jgi:hypothetical protein
MIDFAYARQPFATLAEFTRNPPMPLLFTAITFAQINAMYRVGGILLVTLGLACSAACSKGGGGCGAPAVTVTIEIDPFPAQTSDPAPVPDGSVADGSDSGDPQPPADPATSDPAEPPADPGASDAAASDQPEPSPTDSTDAQDAELESTPLDGTTQGGLGWDYPSIGPGVITGLANTTSGDRLLDVPRTLGPADAAANTASTPEPLSVGLSFLGLAALGWRLTRRRWRP